MLQSVGGGKTQSGGIVITEDDLHVLGEGCHPRHTQAAADLEGQGVCLPFGGQNGFGEHSGSGPKIAPIRHVLIVGEGFYRGWVLEQAIRFGGSPHGKGLLAEDHLVLNERPQGGQRRGTRPGCQHFLVNLG